MTEPLKQTIELPLSLYRRLQSLACPLEDTSSTVIERLIDFYVQSHGAPPSDAPGNYVTSRGERIPIGLELSAFYKKEHITATVTEDGILCEGRYYMHPSGAAVEVKRQRGLSEKSAQTNGWLFWFYTNAANRRVVLETLRRKNV
jgi:hypothetical protein